MEIRGIIIEELPERRGVNDYDGKEWVMRSYVIETNDPSVRYQQRLVFTMSGTHAALEKGREYVVEFRTEARRSNDGRWWNNIRGVKAELTAEQRGKQEYRGFSVQVIDNRTSASIRSSQWPQAPDPGSDR